MDRTPIPGDASAALLVAVLVAACGSDARDAGWVAEADTVGGVVRVVNTPPPAGTSPSLVAVEELQIGTVEGGGPMSFGAIRSVRSWRTAVSRWRTVRPRR